MVTGSNAAACEANPFSVIPIKRAEIFVEPQVAHPCLVPGRHHVATIGNVSVANEDVLKRYMRLTEKGHS